MVGNFKFMVLLFICISCINIEKQKITATEIITQNIDILLENPKYFDTDNTEKTIFLNKEIIGIDSDLAKNIFVKKFNLNKNNIQPILFSLNSLHINSIDGYNVSIQNGIANLNDKITFQFANVFISENGKYSCVEVISQRGIGAKFILYLFQKDKNKWLLVEKKIIALG